MRIRQHLTYANVAATLALAGVIGGGGAYAAGVIDSADIENNTVRSADLKNRVGVKGRDVKESTLDAAEFAPMAGGRGSCDPPGASFVSCASTSIDLNSRSRLFIVATGDFFSGSDGASLTCRIAVDGVNTQSGSSPGEQVLDNTDLAATDGFAATLVTGRVQSGRHSAALRCAQVGSDEARLAGASIAVLGIGT